MRAASLLGLAALLSTPTWAENHGWTRKHEEGRCAMRGQCGAQSFFGAPLPCPNNTLAEKPKKEMRKKLVDICGPKWSHGPVCCDEEQVRMLRFRPTVALPLMHFLIALCRWKRWAPN